MSAICSSLLLLVPVKASTQAPFFFANWAAAITFAEAPLVEIAHRMSPSLTSASTCLANVFS